MKLRFLCIVAVTGLSFSLPVAAQSPEEVEALARPRDGESATLDLQTIRRFGDVIGRFEVTIVWADATRPVPNDYIARRVRYAANCEEGTLTLAAVGLFDRSGQVQKTMVVPPGASDPVKPPRGTDQAKWVQRVCMF